MSRRGVAGRGDERLIRAQCAVVGKRGVSAPRGWAGENERHALVGRAQSGVHGPPGLGYGGWWGRIGTGDGQRREVRANCVDVARCSDVRWTPAMCGDVGTNVAMSGVKRRLPS